MDLLDAVPDFAFLLALEQRWMVEDWAKDLSPARRREWILAAQELAAAHRKLAEKREQLSREQQAHKNHKAVQTLHSWRADPTPDPDQVEASDLVLRLFGESAP